MERLLVESAVRASVIAATTALVLWGARIRTPAMQHGAWTGVLIAMLLLPLWVAAGTDMALPVLPRQPARAEVAAAPAPSRSRPATPSAAALPSRPAPALPAIGPGWNWQRLGLAAYALVACVFLARLAAGTVRARRLLRRSWINDGRLTSAACASPVTVGWFCPVVVLPDEWPDWPPAKLDAVLVHEREHVRRRDTLVQWLALLNRAIFWCHPVAWWLERRLASLAEQSCDDAVLASGHDPQDYSAYLLETAHSVRRGLRVSPAAVFMPGAFLPQRIRRMLEDGRALQPSRARAACAMSACGLTLVASTVVTPVRASQSADSTRIVARPIQPRWISPDSTLPQPVSLEWMDGDEWAFQVQPIITDAELLAYSTLTTAGQRNAFIARFWADRDPTPGTVENEFQAEYTRRVQFASERFAASQSGFGFDTDRGRVYLMLGAPDAIETEAVGAESAEIWRYASLPAGGQLTLRFPLTRTYCGYRIVSPAPAATIGAAATAPAPGDPESHASVQLHPFGITALSIPIDEPGVVGARYELDNVRGIRMDEGEIGWLEDGAPAEPVSQHLPPSYVAAGFGCTHALPAGSYRLSATVRFSTGRLRTETVAFEVP